MGVLSREVNFVQNPALGAALLFNCAASYVSSNLSNSPMPIPLLYLVLPIVLHEETGKIISSTQQNSGLRLAVSKFSDSSIGKNDLLLSIHNRALIMRDLTTRSLAVAVAKRLLTIDVQSACVIPFAVNIPNSKISRPVSNLYKSSTKLGFWFSNLTLQEITITLKIAL